MKSLCLFLVLLSLSGVARANEPKASPSEAKVNKASGTRAQSEDYARVARQRAEKIVAALEIGAVDKRERVSEIIARQYRDLNAIHEVRDAEIAAVKASGVSKQDGESAVASARARADEALGKLHGDYLGRLASELTPAEIEKVKDGMTYGVLPLTYRVYQEMIPDLTDDQKRQILAWLTEARERAMDGSTSHEKHAVFGKYKGKINNYLSAAGIDMKAAEKNLRKKPSAAPTAR